MLKHTVLAGLALMGAAIAPAWADCPTNRHEGSWTPGPVINMPVPSFCARDYSCGPKDTVMTDASCTMHSTPKERVTGACSAAGGPVDSCNECLTNPPTTTCEWWLTD